MNPVRLQRLLYLLPGLFVLAHVAAVVTKWQAFEYAKMIFGVITLVCTAVYFATLLLARRSLKGLLPVISNLILLPVGLAQLAGQLWVNIRYRHRLPMPDTYVQANRYRLPLIGTWMVANGGPDPATSHSWELVGQRFAFDFVVTDEQGKSYQNHGHRLEDYYAYGAPVLAPADGVVVKVRDGRRDYARPGSFDPFVWNLLGNYVVIRHAGGEYSLLAHLRRGSIRVRRGEFVRQGQMVGEVGNSGNSSEPHLHFQVQDSPHFLLAASLPVRIGGYRLLEPVHESGAGLAQDPVAVDGGFPVRGQRLYHEQPPVS